MERDKKVFIFLITYSVIILFFYENIVGLHCEELNNKIMEEIRAGYQCNSDSDCEIYPELSDSCVFPGSCPISLNKRANHYYLSSLIRTYFSRGCADELCTSSCLSIDNLRPVCLNNLCDSQKI